MTYLFWYSVIFVIYAYIGYPLVLWFFSLFFRKEAGDYPADSPAFTPRVSLIISAYNEEEIIEQKILNSLQLDYPKDLLRVTVVSDGSDDETDEIVLRYREKGVLLQRFEGRIGKTACLNRAIPLATGDIIVFSDANSLYHKNALRELTKHFIDKKVGFVTGTTRYLSSEDQETSDPVGIYSMIEQFIKKYESRIGSCVGADGAIFAGRKSLYRELKDVDLNDLVIPFSIIKQGYNGVFEGKAYCVEKAAKDLKGEFRRQVRIANRTIRAIRNNHELINPFKFKFFSFELFSHKISRLLVPFHLLLALLSNILIVRCSSVYLFLLIGQLFCYVLACIAYSNLNGFFRRLSFLRAFIIVNVATLAGWIKYLKGDTYMVWTKVR